MIQNFDGYLLQPINIYTKAHRAQTTKRKLKMTAVIDNFPSITTPLFDDFDLLPPQWPEVSMLFDDMSPALYDKPAQETSRPTCSSACAQTQGTKKRNKTCLNCSASRTPQFREGPEGPQTLCNACGVAYRKFGFEGLRCRVQKLSQPRSKYKF